MNETVPAWRVSLDTLTTMVFEIITDTGQVLLDRGRPELGYQNAYAVITEKTRSKTAYVTEQSGPNRRFLQIRENGAITVIPSLPELPSDFISAPPVLPAMSAPERTGPFTAKPKAAVSAGPAPQSVKVKVKVPQAVLYGASAGSLLIGLSTGTVLGLWLR